MSGAYSEIAAEEYFGKGIETCPKLSFTEMFEAVEKGVCDFGMVPIENSTTGSIYQNYDLLAKMEVFVVGEIYLRISHNLLVIPVKDIDKKKRLTMIKTVFSHPQGIFQCQQFLNSYPWMKPVEAYDTAGSAKGLAESKDILSAAIASSKAAKIYRLEILEKAIETNKNNFTRFLVISKEKKEALADKASFVFSLEHRPGQLAKVLGIFAGKQMNLTKIESRPVLGKPWEYLFYLDVESEGLREAREGNSLLKTLKKETLYLKVLGIYKRGK